MRYATLNQSDFSISISLVGYYVAMVGYFRLYALIIVIFITPDELCAAADRMCRAGAVFVTCSRQVVHQLYVARFL